MNIKKLLFSATLPFASLGVQAKDIVDTVVAADVAADNGVIQAIDRALMPKVSATR